MSQIGTLSVGLLGDLSGLFKAFDDAQKKVSEFAKKTKELGKEITEAGKTLSLWITGPLVGAGAALTAMSVSVAKTASELLVLSSQTGISTDSLQEWRYVADQAGASSDAVANAIMGLTRRLPELASETGGGADALKQLGLEFSDIKNLEPERIFEILLERLSAIPSVLERNSVASKVLGLGWKEIAPIIDEGADNVERLRKEAHDLGLVIGKEGLQTAERFGDAWDSVKAQFIAVKNQIGIEFAPMLENTLIPVLRDKVIPFIKDVADKIKNLIEGFLNLDPRLQAAIISMLLFVAAVGPAVVLVGKLVSIIASLSSALSFLVGHPVVLVIAAIGSLVVAWASMQEGLVTVGEYIKEFFIDLANVLIWIFNGLKANVETFVNSIIYLINLIPGINLDKINLDPTPYLHSLERMKGATNEMVEAIDSLAKQLESIDKIRYDMLIKELQAVAKSVTDLPVEKATIEFERMATEIINTYSQVYPELGRLSEEFIAKLKAAAAAAQESMGETAKVMDKEWESALIDLRVAVKLMTDELDPELEKLRLEFSEAVIVIEDAEKGTVAWANAVQAFQPIYDKVVKLQEFFINVTGEGNEKLQLMIDRAKELGIVLEELPSKILTLSQAIQEFIKSGLETTVQILSRIVSAVNSTISSFFDNIVSMKETNAKLLGDYEKTLDDIAEAEGAAVKTAVETRERNLRDLKDSLADQKITREQYAREYAQIEEYYTYAVMGAASEREQAMKAERNAYEQQKIGIGDILGDMLNQFLRAAREQLTLEASKWAVIGAAEALALNIPGSVAAFLAAARYLAGAAALAVAGFSSGGIVGGALGEPQIILAEGGERVLTVEQQQSLVDYPRLAEAVSAGVYDAMNEVLPGKERPLYLVTDGKVWARMMLPALQREEQRLGLVMP